MTFQSVEFLNQAMNASDLRQKTISNNIANINTPGYKVERVLFEEKLRKATNTNELALRQTNERHIPLGNNFSDFEPELARKNDTSVKDNGNNVDLEYEMSEKAVNELYYSTLQRQVNHELSQLNYVINH
ncbi:MULTISPECIES: flagellar basal body rod protein FlgB [Vagococcus]|uniref:Flagellar basal body rod protein FlgB n=1 Tax=Vagococcus fluvialis bH819 TaxID=1255619 RepID=A0A1X6WRH2_9ENTE|nr:MULTISPECIES: flagellar basal body rod protein FlgB [Vagococcus]SLM86875.1 Flagellar basal-body rod protein FlgB [Vagococcus fluvialis bH819]HCM88668.1 flagellar basal body rod protein FlgB [Vagococcus sp.]